MNNKQAELNRIIDIVVSCCVTNFEESGTVSITRQQVLGKKRDDNLIMTRCVLVRMIKFAGFSTETISKLLNRTRPAIREMMKQAQRLYKQSRAYKIAEDEADEKCNNTHR